MRTVQLNKKLSAITMAVLTAFSSVVPSAYAGTTPICDAGNPTTANGGTPGCAVTQFPSGPYVFPKLNWQQVAYLDNGPDRGPSQLISGNRLLVNNNRAALALGLNASEVADVVAGYSTNAPTVFARYNPMSAELRIDIFKVENVGNRKTIQRAAYTPAHGRAFAAALTYSSGPEKEARVGPGINPFELFGTPADEVFHNVSAINAVQVAVGHAMRVVNAPLGLVAVANVRVVQKSKKSGGWFKKTITQTTEGWSKPIWHIVTPMAMQQRGDTAYLCAGINVAQPADCPASRVVYSGVSWTIWNGGTLPAFEDKVSHHVVKKSGFTLLAGILLGFPGALDTLFMGALGMSGGAGLGDVVNVGDIVLPTRPAQGARSGFGPGLTSTNKAQLSVIQGMHANFDTATIESSGVRAVTQAAFGTCAPGALIADCGGASGVLPRADSTAKHNTSQFWRDNGEPMVGTANSAFEN